jgi:RNA-directed DNA polymerase
VHRTTRNKDEGRGSPQGAPISPLLANVYMRRFVLGWKTLGHEQHLQARIVNYADDFVICCRRYKGPRAFAAMRTIMERLKLTVNETKTKLCRLPDETFDFLGYTFGRCYSPQTGRAYLGTRPAKSRIRKLYDSISDLTSRRKTLLDTEDVVDRVNRKLRGWANYFRLGPVSNTYRAVDRHVTNRLRQWLCAKHKTPGRGTSRYPYEYLYHELGLVRLPSLTRNLPWAKA